MKNANRNLMVIDKATGRTIIEFFRIQDGYELWHTFKGQTKPVTTFYRNRDALKRADARFASLIENFNAAGIEIETVNRW